MSEVVAKIGSSINRSLTPSRTVSSLVSTPAGVPGAMAATDRDALVILFRSNGGDGWLRKDNWGTDAELSRWYGLRVNGAGRVVKILLGKLKGK